MQAKSLRTDRIVDPVVVVGLLIAAAVAMPFDVPLARFFLSDPFPGELRSLIHKTEFFGHAYGIAGIAFTIYLLCEDRRRQLPRLLCTALFAGVACDFIKILVHRMRPVDFTFLPGDSTFLGISFLHAESFSDIFESAYHSFPSAHTATSIAFAFVLGAMYPKAAKWFLTLAITVAISRFDGGAHFVSDTCIGGLIGYLVACQMLGHTAISQRFAAFENRKLSLVELLIPVARKPRPTAPCGTALDN